MRVGISLSVTGRNRSQPAGPDISVSINSTDLGSFTETTSGGSLDVGDVSQTGSAGPFTEHWNQVEMRISSPVDLTISSVGFSDLSGLEDVALSSAYTNPVTSGQDRYIQLLTGNSLPQAFSLVVSIGSDDPDDPYTLTISGTLTS